MTMTEQKKKLDAITDSIYFYMVELVSLANHLEDAGIPEEGENLRSIVDQLERLGIRLLNRKRSKRRA